MRYFAVATDYDGTLAADGKVAAPTVEALERLRRSGRRVVLVTGRLLEDLQQVFPRLDLIDRVVAENGAVVWTPTSNELQILEEPPPPRFVEALRARGVRPLSIGHVIVATREPHEDEVLEAIRSLGLELHVEFNKGAVMVLPAGVTKRTGLSVALERMGLSLHNVVGVGDAENDHALLAACECSVAVANALDSVAERADWVTASPRGAGVAELVDRLLEDDLASLAPALARHRVCIGEAPGGEKVTFEPYGETVLVAGPSGTGKTAIATALVERIGARGYQMCIVDPEGDHAQEEDVAVVGCADRAPSVAEVVGLLDHPRRSVAVTLLAVPLPDRPRWFGSLLSRVQDLRAAVGRPHWVVVDEAHHVLPAAREDATLALPKRIGPALLVTVHPERVARAVLDEVDVVITTPDSAAETLAAFARLTRRPMPELPAPAEVGHAPARSPGGASLVWRVRDRVAGLVEVAPARGALLRHKRKYAHGDVGEDKSFFFRGPRGALNLRAQNLVLFMQIADGVDDETWNHHLRAGDYSRWFGSAIKDDDLVDEARRVEEEGRRGLNAAETRRRMRDAIGNRYTLGE